MPVDAKHAPYARETAICVDLAYDAMEADIRAEIERSGGEAMSVLTRLLNRLRERRSVLLEFTELTGQSLDRTTLGG